MKPAAPDDPIVDPVPRPDLRGGQELRRRSQGVSDGNSQERGARAVEQGVPIGRKDPGGRPLIRS
jgi:hypothetical protein